MTSRARVDPDGSYSSSRCEKHASSGLVSVRMTTAAWLAVACAGDEPQIEPGQARRGSSSSGAGRRASADTLAEVRRRNLVRGVRSYV
jgi:hypothetical protein